MVCQVPMVGWSLLTWSLSSLELSLVTLILHHTATLSIIEQHFLKLSFPRIHFWNFICVDSISSSELEYNYGFLCHLLVIDFSWSFKRVHRNFFRNNNNENRFFLLSSVKLSFHPTLLKVWCIHLAVIITFHAIYYFAKTHPVNLWWPQ